MHACKGLGDLGRLAITLNQLESGLTFAAPSAQFQGAKVGSSPAHRHALVGASEAPVARPRECAPGAVKGPSCGLAALLSGKRTTKPSSGKPSEKPSLKSVASGRWTRRISRSCRRFNIPLRTRQIQVDCPSLMRNASNLDTFAEPPPSTTRSSALWQAVSIGQPGRFARRSQVGLRSSVPSIVEPGGGRHLAGRPGRKPRSTSRAE